MGSVFGTVGFTITPIDGLFDLSQVNGRLRRLAEAPLWESVDLAPDARVCFGPWRSAMLATRPELWKKIFCLNLDVAATAFGAGYASLVLAQATNVTELRYSIRNSDPSQEEDQILPFALMHRLRHLPLKTLILDGFTILQGLADPTFHFINDLPLLRNVAFDNSTYLAQQLTNTRRCTLNQCDVSVGRSAASKILARASRLALKVCLRAIDVKEPGSMWTTASLDMLDRSFEERRKFPVMASHSERLNYRS
ncbi:hypothetical protein P7C70_g3658, partial [Phenoliferia sp. Uapishka_3]